MTRQYCDRCNADISNTRSASASIVADADTFGSGTVTTRADLCDACRRGLERWLKGADLATAATAANPGADVPGGYASEEGAPPSRGASVREGGRGPGLPAASTRTATPGRRRKARP